MNRNRAVWSGLAAVMVLAACTPHESPAAPANSAAAQSAAAESNAPTTAAPTTAAPALAAAADRFAFGVEYTELGLAAPFGAAGVRWAKTRLEAFAWGAVEPVAPIGGHHTYNWGCTDALVAEYQKAGVVNLQSYVSSVTSWASQAGHAPAPSPAHSDDFRAFIEALVERYDGDGHDDMPGLRTGIHDWVIGGEWTGYWPSGNADDYIATLRVAATAVRTADPTARVGAIPFMLYDVFGGNPSTADAQRRLADPPPSFRQSTKGMLQIIDAADSWDYLDLHSLGDYTEIGPMVSWARTQLQARHLERDIWIDDAFPTSLMVNRPLPTTGWPTFAPVTRPNDVFTTLTAVADGDPAATAWMRAETAKGVIHKAMTAYAAGARGINVGNTEDWTHDTVAAIRHVNANLLGAAAFSGLIDVNHTGGYQQCEARQAGAARPALANVALVAELLNDATSIAPVTPAIAGVYAYAIERPEGRSWVVWAEDGVLQLPGEPEPARSYSLATGMPKVRVRAAAIDGKRVTVRVVDSVNGAVALTLTSQPLVISGA